MNIFIEKLKKENKAISVEEQKRASRWLYDVKNNFHALKQKDI